MDGPGRQPRGACWRNEDGLSNREEAGQAHPAGGGRLRGDLTHQEGRPGGDQRPAGNERARQGYRISRSSYLSPGLTEVTPEHCLLAPIKMATKDAPVSEQRDRGVS